MVDQTYANAIIFSKKEKYGIDKVCRITGNKKSGKNGFSSANAAIEWGNEAKDVITTAVTATIQKKDNEHTLALKDMPPPMNASCKKYRKNSPPSAR